MEENVSGCFFFWTQCSYAFWWDCATLDFNLLRLSEATGLNLNVCVIVGGVGDAW